MAFNLPNKATHDDEPQLKRQRMEEMCFMNGRHRELGSMRKDILQDASSFVGSSSGLYFVRSVYNALQDENIAPEVVPGEDDRLNDVKHPERTSIWSEAECSNATSTTFDQLRELSEEYFEHWHPMYPFVYAPAVLQVFEKIAKLPLSQVVRSVEDHELTMVRAVLSISAGDRRQCGRSRTKAIPPILLFSSYTNATDSVQRYLSTPASVKSLQAVVAVQVFLVSMLRLNGAARLGGLAVVLTFQLGLHRCPKRYSTFSSGETQIRRRLFWTIYCLDRMLCQSLGLPFGIRDDDIDVCLFDYEKHQDRTLHQDSLSSQLATLHFLSRHATIKGMIVELCNKNIDQRGDNMQLCQSIDQSMSRWKNELDTFIELNVDNESFPRGRKAALELLQYELIIALNRPLLALPKHTNDYRVALQVCINAGRTIINGLHTMLLSHLARVASKDEQASTSLVSPSYTWMIWMSAFIVLYATMHQELPVEVAKKLIQKAIDVLSNLSLRKTVWPNACAAAIHELSMKLDSGQYIEHNEINMPINRSTPSHPSSTSTINASMLDAVSAQNFAWSSEASLADEIRLFDGFDIPFSLGDDLYSSTLDSWLPPET